jgi:hypothetical protein
MRPELLRAEPMGRSRILRVDGGGVLLRAPESSIWATALLALFTVGFVLLGGGSLDLGPVDARIGLAAQGPGLSPVGELFGYYAPDLWPLRVLPSWLASAFVEAGDVNPGTVLWPSALAAVAIGWVVAQSLIDRLSATAGVCFGLSWFGCLGVVDHSGSTGIDFLTAAATVAALCGLLVRGSDWTVGVCTALAFLAGGWPPVVVVLAAVLVLGRPDADFSVRLLTPPFLAAVGWSIWALAFATPEAWAAALVWPLTQRPDWWLGPRILALGLPLAPCGIVALSRSCRNARSEHGRRLLTGWLQVAIASLVLGTIVPGLSTAATVPALIGLLVGAAVVVEDALKRTLTPAGQGFLLGFVTLCAAVWLIASLYGGYLWLLVFPYYRGLGIAVLLLSAGFLSLAWTAVAVRETRFGVAALALLAVCLKLAHWGYYVPEWNYRHGQGPWGRAIGQWLLPNWTLYTFHDWPADLAFAIGRPVRKLSSPWHLAYENPGEARYVLLQDSEFQNWPKNAPEVFKVAEFLDRFGNRRILARTRGVLRTPAGFLLPDPTPGMTSTEPLADQSPLPPVNTP